MTFTSKDWPPKGSMAELDKRMSTMSASEMDEEIKKLECELHENDSENNYLKDKIEMAKRNRESRKREDENKDIPFNMSEEEFQTCIGWHGDNTQEFPVNLTVGEMNALHEAVKDYKEKEISKWNDIESDFNSAYGYSKESCNEILSKVRNAQLKIFESMGEDHIRWTQIHKNIGGTIQ
jgi:hypothetical protein